MQTALKAKHTWEKVLPSSCQKRWGHTSTLYKHYIIIYGGIKGEKRDGCGDIHVYNIKKKAWERIRLEGEIPAPRLNHSAFLFDSNKIFIFGGTSNADVFNKTAIITIKETTPLTIEYKRVETTGGKDVNWNYFSADIYQNKLDVVFPGIDVNQLYTLNLKTFNWVRYQTKGEKPGAKVECLCVIYDSKLYLFGGSSTDPQDETSYVLSLATKKWQKLSIQGERLGARWRGSSHLYQNKVFFIGGDYRQPKPSQEILCYDFGQNTLEKFEAQRIDLHSSVLYGDTLLIFGGESSKEKFFSDIHQIKLVKNENDKPVKESHSFGSMLFSKQYSDISFSIENQQIPAHKIVLATRCKYFSNLFTSGMKESHSAMIEVPEANIETYKAFLTFLYQNGVELTETLAFDLYQLADKYMESTLVKLCEEFLSKNLNLENLVTTIEFTEKFQVEALRESVVEFIIKNHEKIEENYEEYQIPDFYLWKVISRIAPKETNHKPCET